MSNEFALYLVTRADDVRFIMASAVFVSGLLSVGCGIAAGPMTTEGEFALWRKHVLPVLKRSSLALFIAVLAFVATPSKRDLLFIYGGSAILDAVKSDRAATIGNKTLDAVESWIDAATKKDGGK